MKSVEFAQATAAPPPGFKYLDEARAADYLLSSRRRLKDLRLRGGGPPFVRLGAAVRYRTDWLDRWAVENAVSSTSEEAARRRDGPGETVSGL